MRRRRKANKARSRATKAQNVSSKESSFEEEPKVVRAETESSEEKLPVCVTLSGENDSEIRPDVNITPVSLKVKVVKYVLWW